MMDEEKISKVHKRIAEIIMKGNDQTETMEQFMSEQDDEYVLYVHGYGLACRILGARIEEAATAILKQRGLEKEAERSESRIMEELKNMGTNLFEMDSIHPLFREVDDED